MKCNRAINLSCCCLGSLAFGLGLVSVLLLGLEGSIQGSCNTSRTACNDEVAVVTGASSGIGAEVAKQYCQRGTRVVLAARRKERLQRIVEYCEDVSPIRDGAAAVAVQFDASDKGASDVLLNATMETFGRVDTLVINHATFDDLGLLEYATPSDAAEQLTWMLRVNTVAPTSLALTFLPHLRGTQVRPPGRLAFISSGTAKASAPFHALYASTKLAVHGIADTLRAELALEDTARLIARASGATSEEAAAAALGSASSTARLALATLPSLQQAPTAFEGAPPSVSLLVLGMIGTPEVMKEPQLRGLAMPVPDCASAMICATDARAREAFIPGYLRVFVGLGRVVPQVTEAIMQLMYTLNVDRYAKRLAGWAVRGQGALGAAGEAEASSTKSREGLREDL